MRKLKNPWIGKEGYNCFGCCPENPIGLHMEFYEDGDEIISFWKPGDNYQGWMGVMHGGILASLIDETCGWTIFRKLQTAGFTTKLDVSYKHAVQSSEPTLTIKAHIKEQRHNLVFLQAEVRDSKEQVCVEANVVYYAVDKERARSMGFTHCGVEDDQLLSM